MDIRTENDGDWTWFYKIAESNEEYSELLKSHSEITGKYLFFSPNLDRLIEIAVREIREDGFQLARVPRPGKNIRSDYVLCLYYKDDSRKDELEERYRGVTDVQYRYWKSNKDASEGEYSKEFLKDFEGTGRDLSEYKAT